MIAQFLMPGEGLGVPLFGVLGVLSVPLLLERTSGLIVTAWKNPSAQEKDCRN